MALTASTLVACSSTGRVVNHAFSFDVRKAVPPVEVLNFRYGTSGLTGASMANWIVKEGTSVATTGVRGEMTVGDSLYVKWRLKETGEIFEETVDLRKRLPHDIKNREVAFYIIGKQLYIYVVELGFLPIGAPEEIPPGAPIKNLPLTYHSKYKIIYPNQTTH